MPLATISVSPEFMFSYIHGLWAKAIRGEELNALIRADGEEALVNLLKDKEIQAERYDSFHRDLQLREIRILDSIRSKIDRKSASFYTAFLKQTYYKNLKTLLHYRYFKEEDVNLDFLLVAVPDAPIDVKGAVKAEKQEDFLKCLNLGKDYDAFQKCVQNLEENQDIIAAECTIDQLTYDNLLKAAQKLNGQMKPSAVTLVRQEIDVLNICALLRIVRTYRYAPEQVHTMWLEHGAELSPKQLTELSQLNTVKEVIALLPKAYAKQLKMIAGGELYLSENKLWADHYHTAMQIFRETRNFAQVLVAFPFLQHAETKNIGRIYEGVHFGVQPRDMFDMMIQ